MAASSSATTIRLPRPVRPGAVSPAEIRFGGPRAMDAALRKSPGAGGPCGRWWSPRRGEFSDVLDAERALGRSVGVVPTMGALHAGHRSLVERAAAECDVVAVTVFVNPLQFDNAGDLAAYPRDLRRDVAMAGGAGATLVFAPPVHEMYGTTPAARRSTVHVDGVSEGLEGASRPGHFDGVSTVVAKLFALSGRCRAYFGEKDFQQLAVVRRMVADLSIPVTVVGCPTVREADGLAPCRAATSACRPTSGPPPKPCLVPSPRGGPGRRSGRDPGRGAGRHDGGPRGRAARHPRLRRGRRPRARCVCPFEVSGEVRLLVAARSGRCG